MTGETEASTFTVTGFNVVGALSFKWMDNTRRVPTKKKSVVNCMVMRCCFLSEDLLSSEHWVYMHLYLSKSVTLTFLDRKRRISYWRILLIRRADRLRVSLARKYQLVKWCLTEINVPLMVIGSQAIPDRPIFRHPWKKKRRQSFSQ